MIVSGTEHRCFPETLTLYLSFGKSYLIPETTNSGIGEDIVKNKLLLIT